MRHWRLPVRKRRLARAPNRQRTERTQGGIFVMRESDIATENQQEHGPDRRKVLSGMGLAAAAALTGVPAEFARAATEQTKFWNKDYVAMKRDVKLQLYRRRAS